MITDTSAANVAVVHFKAVPATGGSGARNGGAEHAGRIHIVLAVVKAINELQRLELDVNEWRQ